MSAKKKIFTKPTVSILDCDGSQVLAGSVMEIPGDVVPGASTEIVPNGPHYSKEGNVLGNGSE